MAPERSMTAMSGNTFVSGKFEPQSPTSPTSPANSHDTDDTLRGDAVINMGETDHDHISSRMPSVAESILSEASAQPQKRPTFAKRISSSFKSEPDPDDVREVVTRKLEETPNGFPRLAAFQSSEANFGLYRSFSYLHSRLLLDLQDEITTLEKELDELDLDDAEEDENRLKSRDYDLDTERDNPGLRKRRKIMKELRLKLMEYDQVLINARTLEQFQRPSDRNYNNLRRYHHNDKPLMDAEMESIRAKEDIVSIRSDREWASFDGAVEHGLQRVDKAINWFFKTEQRPLQRIFRTPELREKTKSPFITYYSSSRIEKLVGMLITIIIFILLVIPVIVMYHLTNSDGNPEADSKQTFNAVGVLIVFTLLFSAAMSMLTKAARHELFAASAAYCAILVVFIGNFTGPAGN